jgi:hypothetical protein
VANGLIAWNQPKFSSLKSATIQDLSAEEIYFRAASKLSKPIRKLASS